MVRIKMTDEEIAEKLRLKNKKTHANYVPTGRPRGRVMGQKNKTQTMAQKEEKRKLVAAKQKENYVPTGKALGRPKGTFKPDHLKKTDKPSIPERRSGRSKKVSE
eukprot:GFUD01031067.1.p1 GENE.GFUD01031067.1~~GFUD01031067.1.p1  ORF type:complete len:105 (+),score=30.01 GFUD01031067.1:74-388(+)